MGMVPREILRFSLVGGAVEDLRASITAMMNRFPAKSLVRGPASEPGPECPHCHERTLMLIMSSCGHTLCEHCWRRCCEAQIAQCRSERKRPSCHCQVPLEADVWRALSKTSQSLGAFESERQSVVARLEKTACRLVKWSP